MTHQKKPYLVVPFLIEQSTWGGSYICEKKGWLNKPELKGKKIGQSYELYSNTFLAADITSSDDKDFSPLLTRTLPISGFEEKRPFPLIKFTQAKGNSFQVHLKVGVSDPHWKQKAESWYMLEDGKITVGVKKGIDIGEYKKTCILLEKEMKRLSGKIINKSLSKQDAQKEIKKFIHRHNPWQYVNVYDIKKGDILDLSSGGLHHSWEEDDINYPLGNIIYEVQQDVMDPLCTIRSFDKGKFKEDGSIREIHIEDYFKYLDTDESRNTLVVQQGKNGKLFDTPHYSLSLLSLSEKKEMESAASFHHLFVQGGKVEVVDKTANKITVGEGHSCFIPQGVNYYIQPHIKSEILLTYLH